MENKIKVNLPSDTIEFAKYCQKWGAYDGENTWVEYGPPERHQKVIKTTEQLYEKWAELNLIKPCAKKGEYWMHVSGTVIYNDFEYGWMGSDGAIYGDLPDKDLKQPATHQEITLYIEDQYKNKLDWFWRDGNRVGKELTMEKIENVVEKLLKK